MEHPLNGKWDVVITSKMGQQKAVWDLQVEGTNITGKIFEDSGKQTGVVESTESLSESSFGFKTTLNTRFGTLGFAMTGQIEEAGRISGEAVMKMMGASKFAGTRKTQDN